MALDSRDVKALADAITDVANPFLTRGKPWRGWQGEAVTFELHAHLTTIGEDGLPARYFVQGKPGEQKVYPRITMPREKARMYERNKLGRIVGPAIVEAKGPKSDRPGDEAGDKPGAK